MSGAMPLRPPPYANLAWTGTAAPHTATNAASNNNSFHLFVIRVLAGTIATWTIAELHRNIGKCKNKSTKEHTYNRDNKKTPKNNSINNIIVTEKFVK